MCHHQSSSWLDLYAPPKYARAPWGAPRYRWSYTASRWLNTGRTA